MDNQNIMVPKSEKAFVIAEIGHNHQGSIKIAREMMKSAKDVGVDAVKFQKRDNKSLFTKKLYDQPYENENSYGRTYGEHREALEFGKSEYIELQDYAKELDIMLFATPFDFKSVEFLADLNMPAYKIASADLSNTPLQKEIAKLKKPIYLSTGGGTISDIRRACEAILPLNDQLYIMHCTASYPTKIEDMNLNVIQNLIREFPSQIIGLSDHENGIDAASIAFMLGARVFEKHFTLNRAWKGTDQSFSLEPEGLRKLVRNLNRINIMRGSGEKHLLECEEAPLKKMAKSIVAAKYLSAGHVINDTDIAFKSPSGGLPPYEYRNVIGMILHESVNEDQHILFENLIPNNVK
jgi:N-acetylneuraminate synthase/sialic acid synthase